MKNMILFRDWETGSRNPHRTQPLQLCAVAIDPIKLEVKENGIWHSYIKPITDPEECERLGLDLVQDEALEVNGISWQQLEEAPSLASVWDDHVAFVKSYCTTSNNWDYPVRAGFNNTNFDNKIDDRLCFQFGQWDDKWHQQKLFHPLHSIDVMHDIFRWTYRDNPRSISMDTTRKRLGIDSGMAHNAVKDCLDGAFLVAKFWKLYNHFTTKVKWEGSFEEENKAIAALLEKHLGKV